jgi:OFA family oxalate/formate antiporter-like MFS transporter
MTRTARGILAVAGSSAAVFWPGALIFGYPGVMSPYWREMFNVGTGATGNVMFFVLAAVGSFMFVVGQWQEKVGIRLIVSISALVCGLSLLIVSHATNIYAVYIWAFLTGTGSCFAYMSGLTVVQRWFPEKKGLVAGIVNLFFAASAAIMAPVFSSLLKTLGYVPMNTLIAVVTVVTGLVAAQLVQTPEKAGYGVKPMAQETNGESRASLKETVVVAKQTTSRGAQKPAGLKQSLTVGQSVRTKSFWFLWVTWALQGAAGIAMITLSVAFGLNKWSSMEYAILLLTTFNLTSGISRILAGLLSDVVGRNLTLSLTFFAAGCAYFGLPHMNSLGGAAVLVAIIGFSFGTMFSVSGPLVSDCFGLQHFGAIFGLVFTAYGFLAGILGPSLSGYLLDSTAGNFPAVFAYLGVFCIVSGLLVRMVVPPHTSAQP